MPGKTKDPTPRQIASRAAEIRETAEFQKRLKPKRNAKDYWTPPLVICSDERVVRDWEEDE